MGDPAGNTAGFFLASKARRCRGFLKEITQVQNTDYFDRTANRKSKVLYVLVATC